MIMNSYGLLVVYLSKNFIKISRSDRIMKSSPELVSRVGEAKYLSYNQLPSGKHTNNYGQSPFLMGKLIINGNFP